MDMVLSSEDSCYQLGNLDTSAQVIPLTHIAILTADRTVFDVSVELCKQSMTLDGLLTSYPDKTLKQLMPIPFQYPDAVHFKLIEYWLMVTKRELPDRSSVSFFSLTQDEMIFMNGICLKKTALYSTAAQMMGSIDFVHVLGLSLALRLGNVPAFEKSRLLGFDNINNSPQKIAEIREQMGPLLLGLLHLK